MLDVKVPLSSRESDIPKSAAYISFNEVVDSETIAVIKAIMHNTSWDKSKPFIMKCHYSRTNHLEKGDNKFVKKIEKRVN